MSDTPVTTNRYNGESVDLLCPAIHVAPVTPSDTEVLAYTSKRLWIGGAGNVSLVTLGGETAIYTNVPAGSYLNVRVNQVKFTGTTATDIIAEC